MKDADFTLALVQALSSTGEHPELEDDDIDQIDEQDRFVARATPPLQALAFIETTLMYEAAALMQAFADRGSEAIEHEQIELTRIVCQGSIVRVAFQALAQILDGDSSGELKQSYCIGPDWGVYESPQAEEAEEDRYDFSDHFASQAQRPN